MSDSIMHLKRSKQHLGWHFARFPQRDDIGGQLGNSSVEDLLIFPSYEVQNMSRSQIYGYHSVANRINADGKDFNLVQAEDLRGSQLFQDAMRLQATFGKHNNYVITRLDGASDFFPKGLAGLEAPFIEPHFEASPAHRLGEVPNESFLVQMGVRYEQ